MLDVPVVRATSVAEFQQIQRQIIERAEVEQTTMRLWFRGQARWSWPLLPSLYRDSGPVNPVLERELTRDFRMKGAGLSRVALTLPRAMFLMQHYGLPTRLLDWTENPLFALYFATEAAAEPEDACVWVMSPWKLNQITAKAATIPTVNHPLLGNYVLAREDDREPRAVRPLAVRAAYDSPRIRAQSGVFTIHGKEHVRLEQLCDDSGQGAILARITIPRRDCAGVKRELFGIDISRGRLFPDLSGVAADILYRHSSAFQIRGTYVRPSTSHTNNAGDESGTSVAFPHETFEELIKRSPTSEVLLPPQSLAASVTAQNQSAADQARVFARQLVTTIKETHPEIVAQGLLTRDLYNRLQEQIELARRGYEREIAMAVRSEQDFFTEALVQVLANGEYWLLGL